MQSCCCKTRYAPHAFPVNLQWGSGKDWNHSNKFRQVVSFFHPNMIKASVTTSHVQNLEQVVPGAKQVGVMESNNADWFAVSVYWHSCKNYYICFLKVGASTGKMNNLQPKQSAAFGLHRLHLVESCLTFLFSSLFHLHLICNECFISFSFPSTHLNIIKRRPRVSERTCICW